MFIFKDYLRSNASELIVCYTITWTVICVYIVKIRKFVCIASEIEFTFFIFEIPTPTPRRFVTFSLRLSFRTVSSFNSLKTQTLLMHAILFWCFHNPPNLTIDIDYTLQSSSMMINVLNWCPSICSFSTKCPDK